VITNKYCRYFIEGGIPELFVAENSKDFATYLPYLGIDYSEEDKANISTVLDQKIPELEKNNSQSISELGVSDDSWYQFCDVEWKLNTLQALIKTNHAYLVDWFVSRFILTAYDTYAFMLTFQTLENNKFSLEINGQKHQFSGGISSIIEQFSSLDLKATQMLQNPNGLYVEYKDHSPEQPDPLPDDYVEPDYTNQYLMRLDNFESETSIELEERKRLVPTRLQFNEIKEIIYGFLVDNQNGNPRIGFVYNVGAEKYTIRIYTVEDILNARYLKIKAGRQIIETPPQIGEYNLSGEIKIWSCLWGVVEITRKVVNINYNPNQKTFEQNQKITYPVIGESDFSLPQNVSYSAASELKVTHFTLSGSSQMDITSRMEIGDTYRYTSKIEWVDDWFWKVVYSFDVSRGSVSGEKPVFIGLKRNEIVPLGNIDDYFSENLQFIKRYCSTQWKYDGMNGTTTLYKDSQRIQTFENMGISSDFMGWDSETTVITNVSFSGDSSEATSTHTGSRTRSSSPDFDNDWVMANIPYSGGNVSAIIDARYPNSICYVKIDPIKKPNLSLILSKETLEDVITEINEYLNYSYEESLEWLNELKANIQGLKEFDLEKIEGFLDEFERKYYTILYNNFCGWEVIKKLSAGQTYFILATLEENEDGEHETD